MTVSIGDIVRTTVNFALADGTQYQNVYHHKRGGVGDFSDAAVVTALELWAEAMYQELVSLVRSNVVEQLSYVDRVEWDVSEWVVVENIGTFTPLFVPVAATDAMPNQVSPFVVFKTARPRTVGRKFLFPLTEAAQDAGILTAGSVTAIVAYADDAVNDIILAPAGTLVPGVPRTSVNDWQEFYVAVVTDLLGTQRRRRPGYGA
jgi:hypothetical protein